jgi:nucleotide-binding universal stress UspA family protein
MAIVLAATDFSAPSRTAVRLAAAVARRQGAPLMLFHAVESPALDVPAVAVVGASAWETELLAAAERQLERLASELRQTEMIAVETRAAIGSPAGLIVDIARQIAADLIVVGTHGRKGAAHLFLGSVAEHVVRASRCPVLVTREGAAVQSRWDGRRPLDLAIVADGTNAARTTYYWARTAGRPLAGDVSLIRVYWPPQEAAHYGVDEPWSGDQGQSELLTLIERDLRRDARALAGAREPRIRFRVASRNAGETISQDARELGADALVIGIATHATSARPVRPTAILRAASVPVFCIPEAIRPAGRRIAPVRSLLIACDLSDGSKAAVLPAYGLLSGGGRAEICYVHALGPPDPIAGMPHTSPLSDDERAAIESRLGAAIPPEAAEHGIVTHTSVIEAPFVDQAILAAAERFDVDVVALASHGRSGLSRALIGSVAEQVARQSPRPVFIVGGRPGAG